MSPKIHAFTQRNRETRELEYIEIAVHPPGSTLVIDAKKAREGDVDVRLADAHGSRTVTLGALELKLMHNITTELLVETVPRSERDVVDEDRIFVTIENYSDLNMMELHSGMELRFGVLGGPILETITIIPRGSVRLMYTADGWRKERHIR